MTVTHEFWHTGDSIEVTNDRHVTIRLPREHVKGILNALDNGVRFHDKREFDFHLDIKPLEGGFVGISEYRGRNSYSNLWFRLVMLDEEEAKSLSEDIRKEWA